MNEDRKTLCDIAMNTLWSVIGRNAEPDARATQEYENAVRHISQCEDCLERLDDSVNVLSGGRFSLRNVLLATSDCDRCQEGLASYVDSVHSGRPESANDAFINDHITVCDDCGRMYCEIIDRIRSMARSYGFAARWRDIGRTARGGKVRLLLIPLVAHFRRDVAQAWMATKETLLEEGSEKTQEGRAIQEETTHEAKMNRGFGRVQRLAHNILGGSEKQDEVITGLCAVQEATTGLEIALSVRKIAERADCTLEVRVLNRWQQGLSNIQVDVNRQDLFLKGNATGGDGTVEFPQMQPGTYELDIRSDGNVFCVPIHIEEDDGPE